MRDAEARDRVEKVEQAIAGLPDAIAKIVIDHFEPRIKAVNGTLDRMRQAADGLEALADLVERMGEATNENTELLSVLESELNTLRVDFNAVRAAQAEQAMNGVHLRESLRGVATALGQAVS